MPDETPVETRPEDGARTDHDSPAVAEPEPPTPPPADANGSTRTSRRDVAGAGSGPADAAPPSARPADPARSAAADGPDTAAAAPPDATAAEPAESPAGTDAAGADPAQPSPAAGDAAGAGAAETGTAPSAAGGTQEAAGHHAAADAPAVASPAAAVPEDLPEAPTAPGGTPAGAAPAGTGPARGAAAIPATGPAAGSGSTDAEPTVRVHGAGTAASATSAAAPGAPVRASGGDGADRPAAGDPDRDQPADTDESTEDSDGSDRRRGSFLRELPVLLIVAFGLALLIKTFLVQAFFIPSGSMERTLHGCSGCSGDRVLVNKLIYRFRDPHPGDIVVFRGPESWAPEAQFAKPSNVFQRAVRAVGSAIGVAPAGEKDFVKRVIATGGQTVQCCDEQGRVTVDGRPLNEPYVYLTDPTYRPTPFGPVTVPQGRLWMMGDHRDESADSRVHIGDADQGTIGVSDVVGKAFVIVWPPSRWATLGTPSTFASAAPAGAAVAAPYLLGFAVAVPFTALRRRRNRGAP